VTSPGLLSVPVQTGQVLQVHYYFTDTVQQVKLEQITLHINNLSVLLPAVLYDLHINYAFTELASL